MKLKITILLLITTTVGVILAKSKDYSLFYGTIHSSKKCSVKKNKLGNGEVYIVKINKSTMSYKVDTKNTGEVDFYLNSNFFTNTRPIGEVLVNGKIVNGKVKGGGYFHTTGGDAKITLGNRSNALYSTQTKYIGIRNGVLNQNMFKSKLSRWKTYRTLLGKNMNGDLILVHSGKNGLLSNEDICKIGKEEGMVDALLFDGGSSIEVLLVDGTFKHQYHSVSDETKQRLKIHKPFAYITGKFN